MNKRLLQLWGRLPLTRGMRYLIVWLLSPKFTVGIVALIKNEQGEILLFEHTYRGNRPWGLPGGGLKPGESMEACLRREVHEETGLQIEIDGHLLTEARRDHRHIEVIFAAHLFGCTLADFRPSAEVTSARFFSPWELPGSMYKPHKGMVLKGEK